MEDLRKNGAERPSITYGRETRRVTKADLERVNLPRVFWKSRSDLIQDENVRGVVLKYRKEIDDRIRDGHGVAFAGDSGVGKTSAAACLLKQAIARGYTAYFVTHDELRELAFDDRRLFGDGTDGVTVKQQIARADFLVLDGFNAPFLTDKVFGPLHLERLVSKRSMDLKTTVLTTRVASALSKKEYESLFDMLSSCMLPARIHGENLRDKAREELREKIGGAS